MAIWLSNVKVKLVAPIEVDDLVVEAGLGHFCLKVGERRQEDVVVAVFPPARGVSADSAGAYSWWRITSGGGGGGTHS